MRKWKTLVLEIDHENLNTLLTWTMCAKAPWEAFPLTSQGKGQWECFPQNASGTPYP